MVQSDSLFLSNIICVLCGAFYFDFFFYFSDLIILLLRVALCRAN